MARTSQGRGVIINVHIERLILDGVSVASPEHVTFRTDVEAELRARLEHGGLAPDLLLGGSVSALPPSEFRRTSDDRATDLARQVAGAVYASLGSSASAPR